MTHCFVRPDATKHWGEKTTKRSSNLFIVLLWFALLVDSFDVVDECSSRWIERDRSVDVLGSMTGGGGVGGKLVVVLLVW